MEASEYPKVTVGDGYAVAEDLDALGEGYGFRKMRKGLGVTAFGVNVITMPAGYETGSHFHDVQEELYFVHSGTIEMEFGDGSTHRLRRGWLRARGRRHTAQGSQRRRGRCDLPVRRGQGRLHRARRETPRRRESSRPSRRRVRRFALAYA